MKYQLNIPDKVTFSLRCSFFEHTCNKRNGLCVLSNRSSLNVVIQSWNCWPMCTYCPIIISWLKQEGKQVQDSVHITSNRINLLSNTPAYRLISGRCVCRAERFWYSVFSQTFPETTHTANCIASFWIRGCCWFWRLFSKFFYI